MKLGDSVICIAPVRGLIEGKVYRIVEFDESHVNLLVCQPERYGAPSDPDLVFVWGSRFAFTDFADYIKPTFFATVAVRIKPGAELPAHRGCNTCKYEQTRAGAAPCKGCLSCLDDNGRMVYLPNWVQGS
jgi:hypothetical protein